jgi:glycosyltransferase involved in cell wall biosynthesis
MPFRVSVITPVYNAEEYLRQTVESALRIPDVGEVILVEDGSPDRSLSVCQALAQEHPDRVRLVRHPNGENHGAGPSRNRGVQEARYPFIAFLDADDLYLPHRFKIDKKILLADSSIDGVYNALGITFLDEAGRKWWDNSPSHPPELTTIRVEATPEQLFFCINLIGCRGHFSLNTLTVRRHVFDRLQFSSLRLSQDTLFILQLAALFRLAPGDRLNPVALRGVHGENRIRDQDNMRQAREDVIQALVAWAQTASLPLRHRRAIIRVLLFQPHTWPSLLDTIATHPILLTIGRTYWVLAQRAFFRGKPHEPIFPAFFPAWRTRPNNPG